MIVHQTSKKLSKPIGLNQTEKIKWMTRLLTKARLVGERGEVPIAAVILDKKGRCIGYGGNRRELMKDPLGHAELVALRQASWINNDWRFNDCTLIVNLEPCPMCAQAISFARLTSIIFSAEDKKSGGILHGPKIYNSSSCHHKPSIIRLDDNDRSKRLLQKFFQDKRKNRAN